jgi:nucleotide-binding universal stress UspA family protein
MRPIKHILFPVDFSERCGSTAPYVASMARRLGAKITLLNAVQPYWYGAMETPAPLIVDVDEIKQAQERDLKESFIDEFAGISVDRHVIVGDASEVIKEFAEKNAVDLVMMPTHGYGPFRQFLLGSVAAKVLHDTHLPVWTNVHTDEPRPLVHADVHTIVCATDVAPESYKLMKEAAQFAENTGAKLRLVHVIPAPTAWPDSQMDATFEKTLELEARKWIGEHQKTLGIAAPLCVMRGDIAPAVCETAKKFGADLVVIGRGVIQERLGRLRTNAYAIIRQSPCPVMSL